MNKFDYVMDTPSDYWCDVAAAFLDLGDIGCDFIDRVETAVYNRDFMGGRDADITDIDIFASAAIDVAANALRAGEFPEVRRALDDPKNTVALIFNI